MIGSLFGAFVNVTVLTRGSDWILKRWVLDARKRAIFVFCLATTVEACIWLISRDLLPALQIMLFYYAPFLILWLLTDILRARTTRNALRNGAGFSNTGGGQGV